MKRLAVLVCMLMSISLFAQNSMVTPPRFKLYQTQNIWTLLKLDTSNGKVWQLQYSVEKDTPRMENIVNYNSLVYGDNLVAGRFELYPTNNMYNFILLDTKLGTTYQVQWSTDAQNRGIVPISDKYIFSWKDGIAFIQNPNGQYNFVKESNPSCVVGDLWYDDHTDFFHGYAIINLRGTWNVINEEGEYLLDSWYSELSFNDDSTFLAQRDGKYNIIDIDETPRFTDWYDDISYPNDSVYCVTLDGRKNMVDVHGHFMFKSWYEDLSYYTDSTFVIRSNGLMNIMDEKENLLFNQFYEYIQPCSDSCFYVTTNDRINVLDKNQNLLFKEWYDDIDFLHDDCYRLKKGNTYNLATGTGVELLDEWSPYYLPDLYDGKEINKCFEFGCAIVENNQEYNLISTDGQLVCEKWSHSYYSDFGDNLILTAMDDELYVLDRNRKFLFDESISDLKLDKSGRYIRATVAKKKTHNFPFYTENGKDYVLFDFFGKNIENRKEILFE